MRKRTKAREAILTILYQLDVTNDPIDELINKYVESQGITDEEIQVYIKRVVDGTVERLSEIDPLISKYADNWELDRMAVLDRNILRYSVYELMYMDDIPPKVTINESVNIAKKFSLDDSGKFVNGVLDKVVHSEKVSGI